jgi:DNA replication protein
MPFTGFKPRRETLIPVPDEFFSEILLECSHLGELKVILYVIWRVSQMEVHFPYLSYGDILEDEEFVAALGSEKSSGQAALDEALALAVARGVLLCATSTETRTEDDLYFLNTPKGQAALQAIHHGDWHPTELRELPLELNRAIPDIFQAYEENIGPLTPMIADALKDAEETYPPSWIHDAIRKAVENNKRNWRYVEAILKRWQEGGRDERRPRRDPEKDRRSYVEGEFSDFVEH